MIDADNYAKHIDLAYEEISNLPTGEIKYYLFLLATAIKEKNNTKTQFFLTEFLRLLETLKKLHDLEKSTNSDYQKLFTKIYEHYNELTKIAETNHFSTQLKNYLLHAAGVTLMLIFGVVGGAIGGLAGFVRGLWLIQPLKGLGIGFITGIFIGSVLGFRLPKKLFKEELGRQMKFGLDGLKGCIDGQQKELPSFFNKKVKPISVYQQEVEAEIRALFNHDDEFNEFLNSNTEYYINSLVATFIGDPMLAGYVGHHSYIKINIKDALYLVEYAPEPSDLSGPPSQSEKRTVTGRQLLDMLAYHRKLQETHTCDTTYLLTKAKPGETDCLSYVNKILIGTNQEATKVKRFIDMAPVGKVFGYCVDRLNPFQPDFFQRRSLKPVLENGEDLGLNYEVSQGL